MRRKPIPNLVKFPGENGGPTWADGEGEGYYDVRNAFVAAMRLFFPKVVEWHYDVPKGEPHPPVIPDTGHFAPTGMMATYHQMTPEQQVAANALYDEIGKAIRQAYRNGLERGRDLLGGLARGEVAISDFERGVVFKGENEE